MTKSFSHKFKTSPHQKVGKVRVSTTLLRQRQGPTYISSFKTKGISFKFQRCFSRAGVDNRTRDVVCALALARADFALSYLLWSGLVNEDSGRFGLSAKLREGWSDGVSWSSLRGTKYVLVPAQQLTAKKSKWLCQRLNRQDGFQETDKYHKFI